MGRFRVSETVTFIYGHRLMEYQGKCARIHGHNARVEIELGGDTLDHKGFVADFEDIGKVARAWLDKLDHRLILREDDPIIPFLKQAGEDYVTLPVNPSAENFAKLLFDHLAEQGHPIVAIRFWETDTAVATYEK